MDGNGWVLVWEWNGAIDGYLFFIEQFLCIKPIYFTACTILINKQCLAKFHPLDPLQVQDVKIRIE
jgi:hypothetical protein